MAENEQPYVDPHHRVPDDQWGQVVRDAAKYAKEAEEAAKAQEEDPNG